MRWQVYRSLLRTDTLIGPQAAPGGVELLNDAISLCQRLAFQKLVDG